MLDVNTQTAELQYDIGETIRGIVYYILNTPYYGRVFNPRKGSGLHTLLYETQYSIVRDMHLSALLISALTSSLPGTDVSLEMNYKSDGRGSQTLYIKFTIVYQEQEYKLSYSPSEKRFTN